MRDYEIDQMYNGDWGIWEKTKDYKDYEPLLIYKTHKQAMRVWVKLQFEEVDLWEIKG